MLGVAIGAERNRVARGLDEPGSVALCFRDEVVDHAVDGRVLDRDAGPAREGQETPASGRVDRELNGAAGVGAALAGADDQAGVALSVRGGLRCRCRGRCPGGRSRRRRRNRVARGFDEPASVALCLRDEVVDDAVDGRVLDLDAAPAGEEQQAPTPRRVDRELNGSAGIGAALARLDHQTGTADGFRALRAHVSAPCNDGEEDGGNEHQHQAHAPDGSQRTSLCAGTGPVGHHDGPKPLRASARGCPPLAQGLSATVVLSRGQVIPPGRGSRCPRPSSRSGCRRRPSSSCRRGRGRHGCSWSP